MLLDLWTEQSAAGKVWRIWRVKGLGNIDAFKATLCEVTATEPFLHRSSMIPTSSSQNQFSLQNTQTCLTITWTRMSSALTSQGVPPWRSFSKVVISTNFHIRFIAIFIVTRIQMFFMDNIWTQSGCFSVGSCINGKEGSLIPTLSSERPCWCWPTFRLTDLVNFHPDDDWSLQSQH